MSPTQLSRRLSVVEPHPRVVGAGGGRASEKHDVWLWDVATGKSRHRVIEHTPEALADWLSELQSQYPGQRVAVCLEQSRGSLIYALMGHAFLDLYPVNPVTLAKCNAARRGASFSVPDRFRLLATQCHGVEDGINAVGQQPAQADAE